MDRNQPVPCSCPICAATNAILMPPLGDYEDVDCPSCGAYRLTGTAEAILKVKTHSEKKALSKKLRTESHLPRAQRTLIDTQYMDQI